MMKIKHLLQSFFSYILKRIVPVRTRRFTFMTSLALTIKQVHGAKADTLQKINELLNLVDDTDALKIPAMIQDYVWDEQQISRCLMGHSVQEIAANQTLLATVSKTIFTASKPWLRYCRRDDMLNDICEVIKQLGHEPNLA